MARKGHGCDGNTVVSQFTLHLAAPACFPTVRITHSCLRWKLQWCVTDWALRKDRWFHTSQFGSDKTWDQDPHGCYAPWTRKLYGRSIAHWFLSEECAKSPAAFLPFLPLTDDLRLLILNANGKCRQMSGEDDEEIAIYWSFVTLRGQARWYMSIFSFGVQKSLQQPAETPYYWTSISHQRKLLKKAVILLIMLVSSRNRTQSTFLPIMTAFLKFINIRKRDLMWIIDTVLRTIRYFPFSPIMSFSQYFWDNRWIYFIVKGFMLTKYRAHWVESQKITVQQGYGKGCKSNNVNFTEIQYFLYCLYTFDLRSHKTWPSSVSPKKPFIHSIAPSFFFFFNIVPFDQLLWSWQWQNHRAPGWTLL